MEGYRGYRRRSKKLERAAVYTVSGEGRIDDIVSDVWRIVQLTNFLEAGLLPDGGGIGDQAAAFMAAAYVVRGTMNAERARQQEQTRARIETGGGAHGHH